MRRPEVAVERLAGRWLAVGLVVLLLATMNGGVAGATIPPGFDETWDVWPTAVHRADCRSGDKPETGLQGEVPIEDRNTGRSMQGYTCNLDLVGQYQGRGAAWVSASYKNCIYIGTMFQQPDGLEVVDVSDPAHPVVTAHLSEVAMVNGTWESLKVNVARGLLVGTGVPHVLGLGYMSIYDVSQDCAHPRLLNEGRGSVLGMRIAMITHEGNFSPDGNTYWASGQIWASAVDISDPTNPHVIWSAPAGLGSHGMEFTPDGDTMFMSTMPGVNVLDTTAIQDRAQPGFTMHQLLPSRGFKHWADGAIGQHSIYVTYGGVPHLFTIDELGSGGVKLFDASDLSALKLRNDIKLEINLPQHLDSWAISAASSGFFGYDPHYCTVDRQDDPQALACGWGQSGVRVFDVRNPDDIHEIAYFNPPAQRGKNAELTNSAHVRFTGAAVVPPLSGTLAIARAILNGQINGNDIAEQGRLVGMDLSADWCMSPPQFRGNLLYVTCSDNGVMTLRLDPSIYPPR